VIVDDPEGDDAAFSKIKRRRIQDWFTKAILSLGDAKTNYVVVGTRIHSECLTAVLAGRPGWQSRVFKAIMEWPQRMDLWGEWELMLGDSLTTDAERLSKARAFYDEHRADMDLGAKVLWPENEDLYALMLKRATDGHVAFESEKQNNPIDPSRSEWGETFFNSPDIWFDDWPDDLDVKVSALDPSKGKEDDSADFQAMVDIGIRMSQGKIEIFIDSDLSKRHVSSMCEEFIARINCFSPDAAVIEQNQFQELLLDDLEAEAARQGCLCAIGGITNTVRKILRIRRLGTFINRGCLKFKRRSRGNAELIKQLAQFPNADHDDGPDVLEMAIRKARELISDDAEVSNPF
jgi:predicted phage terminase large subunit-like protein